VVTGAQASLRAAHCRHCRLGAVELGTVFRIMAFTRAVGSLLLDPDFVRSPLHFLFILLTDVCTLPVCGERWGKVIIYDYVWNEWWNASCRESRLNILWRLGLDEGLFLWFLGCRRWQEFSVGTITPFCKMSIGWNELNWKIKGLSPEVTLSFNSGCYFIYSIVGWGTMLQAGRSWVRFQKRSLGFSIDLILPAALWPWVDSACNRNEYQESFW
jgi:hypothetical protein